MGAVAGVLGWATTAAGMSCAVVAAMLTWWRRVPVVALIALLLGGFAGGLVAAASRAADGEALGSVGRHVSDCAVQGSVLEPAGGLGTFVAVERVSCTNGIDGPYAGVAVSDIDAPAGSAFAATAWVLPLGEEGFDLARRRAGAYAELQIRDIKTAPPTGVFAVAARVRSGLVDATASVPKPEAGLLRGITIGDTDAIAPPTLEAFRRSGLSHLLAVSGSNVAIVLAGVAWSAARLSLHARVIVCAAALGLFVLVVGPDGSVLRATAMGAIGLVAVTVGRPAEPLHALGTGVALLIAVRPSSVFSLGLHLSVAATAGIILWAPRLNARIPAPKIVSLPLSVTLAAQLGVLPLIAIVFGEVSVIAPISNLAAAPAVAPATVLGFIAGIVAIVHDGLGGLLLRMAEPFATWILFVGEVAARPGWAALEVPRPLGWCSAFGVSLAAAVAIRRHGEPITLRA